MIKAHGGVLINRIAEGDRKAALEAKAEGLYKLQVEDRYTSDLLMIAIGGFSPLKGFMGKADAESVINKMELTNGLVWSIPILLSVKDDKIAVGQEIALTDKDNTVIAIMTVSEKFELDLDNYTTKVYKTNDAAHPGVKVVLDGGNSFIGGDIELLNRPVGEDVQENYKLDPSMSRAEFEKRGWKTVVAFQTRNPIHRAHEYLLKCALESVDGLFIHPLVGETKSDDVPAMTRMKCYQVLMDNYFNLKHTTLGVLPAAMRYAGPKEAIMHMIIRKNYGCTHLIIGRDHAGVGNYYGTYEAQELVDTVADKLGIVPLKFEHTFYCKACGNMASTKTCPHTSEHHVMLSGTKVRDMLQASQRPPVEFSRPEVADILIAWATGKAEVVA